MAEAEAWLAFERGDGDAADRWQALLAIRADNTTVVSHEAARRQLMAIRVMLASGRFDVASALAREGVRLCPDDGALERTLFAPVEAIDGNGADVAVELIGPPTRRGLAWELRAAVARRRGVLAALPEPGDFVGYPFPSSLVADPAGAQLDDEQRVSAQAQLALLRGEWAPEGREQRARTRGSRRRPPAESAPGH